MDDIDRLYHEMAEILEDRQAPWREQAACVGLPVSWFFPERGAQDPKLARHICADCPVRRECLAYGQKQKYGIWGGLTVTERRDSALVQQVLNS